MINLTVGSKKTTYCVESDAPTLFLGYMLNMVWKHDCRAGTLEFQGKKLRVTGQNLDQDYADMGAR